ncbi:hypothetical protein A0H81_11043 [Grifola frondosa]|uniref:Uncharacterized protein n=1 Tax=Grifola frondosa TaxID=5627 RepID=A0A1C7LVN6_GRIFR|nr:hypothetical protein A0H81_11043 [Grifola frondosa]
MFSFSFALVGFIAFAWGPQAVYSHFQFISFSPVVQCGSFFINFHGGKAPSALPLTLTVVPFNATPFLSHFPTMRGMLLPPPVLRSLFFPFQQTPSPSNNTSCLPTDPAPFSNHFTIDDPTGLSQCLPFDVHFNTTVTYAAPSIRGFKPLGPSFPINMTSSDDANGTATYTMDVLRDSQVVLLFTDDTGHKESTSLLAVTGNSASSSHCIPSFAPLATLDAATKKSSAPSRVAIIVIAVVGAKSRFAQFDKGFAEVRPVRDMEKQAGSGSQALASHEVARPSRLRATVTSDTSFYDSACYVRDPLYISSALYSPTTPNNPFDGSLATATTDRDNDSDNGLNSAPLDGALMSLPLRHLRPNLTRTNLHLARGPLSRHKALARRAPHVHNPSPQ